MTCTKPVLAVARVALEETWDYVVQREAFGKPLSAFQGVSHPLADFDTQVEAARLLCLQTLWLKDAVLRERAGAGQPPPGRREQANRARSSTRVLSRSRKPGATRPVAKRRAWSASAARSSSM
jgi:alkylation response protein AidB-like acyl-CoA dehydrogenase